MSRFKTVVPLMVYISPALRDEVKKFAKKLRMPVSQIAREGFVMRMEGLGNDYDSGFSNGLEQAKLLAKETKGAQMMFPSGKSFGELVCDDIDSFKHRQGVADAN
jgi:hypothetical protein